MRIRNRLAALIVQSKVREQLDGMNVSADFFDTPDEEVIEFLADASRRAEANDRKTVQGRDL